MPKLPDRLEVNDVANFVGAVVIGLNEFIKSLTDFMMQDALDDNIGYVFYPFLADVDSRMASPCFMGCQKICLFSGCYPKFLFFFLIKGL